MNTKRFILVFICILLLNFCYVFANNSNNNSIDAILVIDTSNSMNGSDPKKIAVDGIKLFIDMMEYSGSRVGVIGFNDSITFKTGLKEINSFSDKQDLINEVGNIKYIGYTDIGLALKEAEKMLFSKGNKGNKPMIILFTDGYIETRNPRTVAQSTQEVDEVLLGAKNNYPIYTIGLNSSGRVDKNLIDKISAETNALSYMTNNSKDLPEIFNMIFADYIKSNIFDIGNFTMDGQNYNTIDINIPNNSVSEANIIMLSNNPVTDIKLIDPNGNEQPMNGNNKVYLSTQGSYTMLKIIEPQKGDWKLLIKGITGDQVKINLLYNYDISLKVNLQNSTFKKGENVIIKGELFVNNTPLNDPNLMKDFNADLKVINPSGDIIERIPMQNTLTEFTVQYTLPTSETKLSFQIDAAGAGFFRQSNILDIEITNMPPTKKQNIEKKVFINIPIIHNSIKLNLYDYFEDEDDLELKFYATSDNDSITTVVDNGTLILSTNKIIFSASSFISIQIYDGSTMIISEFEVFAFPLMIVIIILIGVITFIIILRKANKQRKISSQLLSGYFEYRFTINGVWQEQKQEPLYNYRGIVALNKIIKNAEIYQMPELSKINIQVIKKEGQVMLLFENKSNYNIMSNFMSKEIILKFDETIVISNTVDNCEVQITYLEDLFI